MILVVTVAVVMVVMWMTVVVLLVWLLVMLDCNRPDVIQPDVVEETS